MIFPTIHLGGTNVVSLIEANEIAIDALRATIQSLADAAPHARDFITRPNVDWLEPQEEVWRNALAEHEARMARLRLVMLDLQSMREYLDGQRMEQEARKAGK